MTPAKLLKAKDVAARLQVSLSRAYEVMREMEPITIGRSLRVSEAALVNFIARNTCVSPVEARSGTRPSTTKRVVATASAPSAPIVVRRKVL